MKKGIIFIAIISTFFSCEKMLIGEDAVNNPEANFELFWNDFDQHYSLFQIRGWDWDSVYATHRPMINMQTTEQELFDTFKSMVAYLDDSHTFVARVHNNFNRDLDFYASGSEDDKQVEVEFSVDLVKEKYLENLKDIPHEDEDGQYFYGNIKDQDIGYLYLSNIGLEDHDFMDDVLKDIGSNKAIILDIRGNGGGEDVLAQAIAGRFADKRKLVYTVQDRNGPKHSDFSKKREYYTEVKGKEHYDKPLIVLTDKITVSAAEILLLHLRAFDKVTFMGTETSGDFSDTSMRRFLPNGFQYQYSIMQFLLPDGSSLDGIGHIPDVYIRNSEADILAGNDKVMERAIEYITDL
ncbi:Tricorn protease C1 domain-containing protein [Spirosomataceae bacterium TFI 002]|nr:Tricorn protease C1 domain-containing protein [Spirosomataceae bacterium TFI 002]